MVTAHNVKSLTQQHSALLSENVEQLFHEYTNNELNCDLFYDHFGRTPRECLLSRLGSCSRSKLFFILVNVLTDGREARPTSDTAIALELFHQATLIIDDAQDHATLRKGQATLWSKYGETEALMFGYRLSYFAASRISSLGAEAAELVTGTGVRMIDGQKRDLSSRWGRSYESYCEIAREKTGLLYALPANLAQVVANFRNDELKAQLERLMLEVGVAHQICDDLKDASSQNANRSAFTCDAAVEQNVRQSIFGAEDSPCATETLFEFVRRRMPGANEQLLKRLVVMEELLAQSRDILKSLASLDALAIWDHEFEPFVHQLCTGENQI